MNDKIIKLLSLADSPNDHEALLAFRSARKMMKSNNVDWSTFFRTNRSNYEDVAADVTKLMKLKLQLQQELYKIQDEITAHEVYLRTLEKKVAYAENEQEGYSAKRHNPDPSDIDEAFDKIFYALSSYSSKKNDFIESLRVQWKEKRWLSPKQISCLRENFIRFLGFEPAW